MMRSLATPSMLTRALNLKQAGIFRLLVLTTCLLCMVIGLGAASTGMLQQVYADWQLSRSHNLTVYLPPDADPAAVNQLLKSLPTIEGVASAGQVSNTQLQAWLKPLVDDAGNLPLPTVVEVNYRGNASPAPIIDHIQQAFTTAEVDDHRPMLQQVGASVRRLQLAAVGLSMVMLALMALFIVLAVRTGLMTELPTLHLLVQLGATDAALTRNVGLQVLKRTLVGYVFGTAAAAAILAVAAAFSPGLASYTSIPVWLALVVIPLLPPVIATLVPLLLVPRLLRRLT